MKDMGKTISNEWAMGVWGGVKNEQIGKHMDKKNVGL